MNTQRYILEETTSVYYPLKSNMSRIFSTPKIRIKKLKKCDKCFFVAGVSRGGRRNCPACLKAYE